MSNDWRKEALLRNVVERVRRNRAQVVDMSVAWEAGYKDATAFDTALQAYEMALARDKDGRIEQRGICVRVVPNLRDSHSCATIAPTDNHVRDIVE